MPDNPNTEGSIQESGGVPVLNMTVSASQTVQAPVDPTLSISEMAADAKATGDAINNLGTLLEQEISDLSADVVLKSMIDATLTQEGEVADAKATGEAIAAVLANLLINGKHVLNNVLTLYGTDVAVSDAQGASTVSAAIQELHDSDNIMYDEENEITVTSAIEGELSDTEINEIFDSVFGGDD